MTDERQRTENEWFLGVIVRSRFMLIRFKLRHGSDSMIFFSDFYSHIKIQSFYSLFSFSRCVLDSLILKIIKLFSAQFSTEVVRHIHRYHSAIVTVVSSMTDLRHETNVKNRTFMFHFVRREIDLFHIFKWINSFCCVSLCISDTHTKQQDRMQKTWDSRERLHH